VHQAAYADRLLRMGSSTGAIWGVSFHSRRLRDALRQTGGAYYLVERSGAIDGPVREKVTRIESFAGLLGACQRGT
jgi:hypothetical protein